MGNKTMADKVEGFLEVGINDNGEVVLNLPEDKTGHIIFSPNQARTLAASLNKNAGKGESYLLNLLPLSSAVKEVIQNVRAHKSKHDVDFADDLD